MEMLRTRGSALFLPTFTRLRSPGHLQRATFCEYGPSLAYCGSIKSAVLVFSELPPS